MSTQNETEIPFDFDPNQQSFRLLELPPPLLSLIASDKPQSLFLKSTPSSIQDDSQPGPAGQVVLCTSDQTYQLRQVQTSNSLFVLQPTPHLSTNSNDVAHLTNNMTAISRCEATLELIPVLPDPKLFLVRSLPVYSDIEVGSSARMDNANSKESLLKDTPLSCEEFERGWINLCAFELNGNSWRPSSDLLFKLWSSVMSAILLKGLDLERGFPWAALAQTVEEDGFPIPLLQALLARVKKPLELLESKCLKISDVAIDKDVCLRFVGAIILESQAGTGEELGVVGFLQTWKDQLPEKWRKDAKLEVIKGSYAQPTMDTITFNDGEKEGLKSISGATLVKASGTNSRKWHEKFKRAR